MVEFLEHINAPKQYFLAREMGLDGPLVELVNILKKQQMMKIEKTLKSLVLIRFCLDQGMTLLDILEIV